MTVQLHRVADLATSNQLAAIVIRRVTTDQLHVGIAFIEEDNGSYSVAHLPWHNKPLRGVLQDCYFWIVPNFSSLRALQVASMCRLILQENSFGLPYALSVPNGCFDAQTGKSLLGPSGRGLTCATFVLAVFHSIGLNLILWETWPRDREGDAEWQRHVVEQLKDPPGGGEKASKEHILEVENQIGAVRCRPEEVAGSSAAEHHPVSFEDTIPLAREVLRQLPV